MRVAFAAVGAEQLGVEMLAAVLDDDRAARIPRPLFRAMILAVDVASAVANRHADLSIYAAHYLRYLARAVGGRRPRGPSSPPSRDNPTLASTASDADLPR